MSYETITTPLFVHTAAKPAVPSSSRPYNEPIAYTSGNATFPYHKTPNSNAQIVKICARKVKTGLVTVGNKILTGLQEAGSFNAPNEQKWQSEHQPFERLASNIPSWESVDATDKAVLLSKAEKHQPKSWTKALRNYWRPQPAGASCKSGDLANSDNLDPKDEEPNIRSISRQLQKLNERRLERMQSLHQPLRLLKRGRSRDRTERIPLMSEPHFSPPRRRKQPLGSQRSGACQRQDREVPEVGENERGDEEDLGTPWSGLQTAAQGHFYGEQAWRDEERIGEAKGCEEENCDGFEAGGELCLRHKSCVTEATTIGGV
jgi:hypothetical protein